MSLLDRALDRARARADGLMLRANAVARNSFEGSALQEVEAEIRELRGDNENLTEYGRHRLREARAGRERLRKDLAVLRAPIEQQADSILNQIDKARRVMRRALRQQGERERLLGLVAACEVVGAHLTFREYETVVGHEKNLAALPEEAETARSPEPDAGAPDPRQAWVDLPDPLPPAALEITGRPEELLERAAAGEWDPVTHYALNRNAQELSLVEGFDVLLAPQSARGLAHYPHQIETARLVLRRMRGRALLCDEVGLGKTIEAGLVAKEYILRGLVRRVLILVPPSLTFQWQEEMAEKFGLQFTLHTDPDFREMGAEAWQRFDRVIASLHSAKMPSHRPHVVATDFDLIIIDEAHHLRNRSTLAWKFANDLKKKYVLLLTATPVQNNLDELFNLITVLSPGHLQTTAAFRKEFVTRGDPRMPRNRERLRQLLNDVMVRNSRSQVQVSLPPRVASTHRIAFSKEEAALYGAVTALVRREFDGGLDRLTAMVLQQEAGSSAAALAAGAASIAARGRSRAVSLRRSLRELADQARTIEREAKAEALLRLLRGTSPGAPAQGVGAPTRSVGRALLFTRFLETQAYLARLLSEAGISYALLSGELSSVEKERAVAEFAAGRQVLISTDVGSEGRNLQFCRTLINYDLPWNPMRIEQRVGRIHRIGQQETVHIHNLCAGATIERKILDVLDAKLNMFEMIVGEIGVILGELDTEEEFEDIALAIWARAADDAEASAGFAQLADQMIAARTRYQKARDYDEALFGEEFTAEG